MPYLSPVLTVPPSTFPTGIIVPFLLLFKIFLLVFCNAGMWFCFSNPENRRHNDSGDIVPLYRP